MSKTQIDKLGERLKEGPHTESDLRLLDEYSQSYSESFERVIQDIQCLGESPTGRMPKSRRSIVEKLRRESIRLSQIQDIAGCRIILNDINQQDKLTATLLSLYPKSHVIDRRNKPSNGYRAVHVIVELSEKAVEIQLRTHLQQFWAELSEKSSDVLDPAIKYGGGPVPWRNVLNACSRGDEYVEDLERKIAEELRKVETGRRIVAEFMHNPPITAFLHEEHDRITHSTRIIDALRVEKEQLWNENVDFYRKAISWLDKQKKVGQ